jgi:hypothetical protein
VLAARASFLDYVHPHVFGPHIKKQWQHVKKNIVNWQESGRKILWLGGIKSGKMQRRYPFCGEKEPQ